MRTHVLARALGVVAIGLVALVGCGPGDTERERHPSVTSVGLAVDVGSAGTGPEAAGYTDLAPYTGPTTVTEDGTVIRGREILEPLVIEADDVTIEGNLVRTATSIEYDVPAISVAKGTRGARITDNEIRGTGDRPDQAPASGVKLYGDDIEFSRNDVHGIAGDAVTLDGDGNRVLGNYIHDFIYRPGTHYDAVVYGGTDTTNSLLLQNNRIEMWLEEDMTAVVSLPDQAENMVVDGNLLAGGAYTLSGGGGGVTFTGNLFSTKFADTCGAYGTHAHLGENGFDEVVWSGNTWADGPSTGEDVEYG